MRETLVLVVLLAFLLSPLALGYMIYSRVRERRMARKLVDAAELKVQAGVGLDKFFKNRVVMMPDTGVTFSTCSRETTVIGA